LMKQAKEMQENMEKAQAELASTVLPQQRAILEQHCARRGVELFIEAVNGYPDWNPAAQTA